MESSAAGGDPRPSPSGGASPPPPPPPPPPRGWLAGLVSGAGRLLASVLGPDPSSSSPRGSASAASGGSASSSPTSLRPPRARGEGLRGGADADFDDSMRVPSKNNMLNQSGKETVLKDYTQGSLAIVSEIEPKDAIMQLLMQETYSRSECSTLIKIIQDRVVDPDSGGIADGEIALPISWKADKQPTLGYSSFSPNVSSPSTSSFQIHGHGVDNSAAADTVPILTPASRSLFNDQADNIQSAFKRRYSVVRDTPEDLRRVRTKPDGNPIHITKFKKVDVVRNRPGEANKLLSDVSLLGANNLAHSKSVSKVERANEKLDVPSKPPAVPNKDLKNGLPLKVETLDGLIPLEQKMMDLSHQKHKDAAYDDSGSVSKLMFMGDIEATPSLQLQNGSKNRRRKQSNSPRTTPRTMDSPAMVTRRRISDATVKAEIDLLEHTTPVTIDKEDPDYVPERRPLGRPRKAR
ncbi:hypothetical protein ZWY2020_000791 [Hordeum vulgare]|nr:hypothetical protein ZWY2020_000791 [Hordeum vulgare]